MPKSLSQDGPTLGCAKTKGYFILELSSGTGFDHHASGIAGSGQAGEVLLRTTEAHSSTSKSAHINPTTRYCRNETNGFENRRLSRSIGSDKDIDTAAVQCGSTNGSHGFDCYAFQRRERYIACRPELFSLPPCTLTSKPFLLVLIVSIRGQIVNQAITPELFEVSVGPFGNIVQPAL
jgi:hypothetical protein